MKENIASLKITNEILTKFNLKAKKGFGQNFIIDSNIIDKIVSICKVEEKSIALEIGPGIGALTQKLCHVYNKVVCFEIDESLIPIHNEYLQFDNLDIIYGDFLKYNLESLKAVVEGYDCVNVVANLPYYITTKLIEKLCSSDIGINQITIMIQKEVAEKMISDYKNPLNIAMKESCDLEYCFTVKSNVFIPKPHVDSAVLSITKNKKFDSDLYELLEKCFTQKRKTINNNLNLYYGNTVEILELANVDKAKRAQELSVEEFIRIKNVIKSI